MCIVFFTATPQYSLVVASNRDEFLARPTTPAAWHAWDPASQAQHPAPTHAVLAGLDLTAGGTWFGIALHPADRTLRLATLTNYTETIGPAPRPSRGNLTRDFLDLPLATSLQAYLDRLESQKSQYAGYNLLVGEVVFPSSTTRLGYVSNRETSSKRARVLDDIGTTGHVRGLSNATLEVEPGDDEWPKVKTGAAAVAAAVQRAQVVSDGRDGAREAEDELVKGLYNALSTPHPVPVQHRLHLRHTVLVRPLCLDPSAPLPELPPPFPPTGASATASSSPAPSPAPADLAPDIMHGKKEGEDDAHWYATRVQTLLLVERATGRVVLRERDAYVLDAQGHPRWSGEERKFEVQL
ncbi:hypothetical protein JCM3770_002040 [Rhodotorula araucariae]